MPLKLTAPPSASISVLSSSLRRLQGPDGGGRVPAPGVLRAAPAPEAVATSMYAHRVYTTTLKSLAEDEWLPRVLPVGWRYVMNARSAAPRTAMVAEEQTGEGQPVHRFASITKGPLPSAMISALHSLEQNQELADRDLEVRLLHVPALTIAALWLHDENDAEDLFVPLAPTNRAVKPGRIYGASEWQELLARLARKAQESPDPTLSRDKRPEDDDVDEEPAAKAKG